MAKQEIKRKEAEVATKQGIGKQVEQVLTVDDSILPSPKELEEYQKVNPEIVEMILKHTSLEQNHRHKMDEMKIKAIGKANGRSERINIWGMFFAFLALVLMIGLCGYALYLDKPWFAGIFGGATIISIISLFVHNGNNPSNG